MVETNTTASAPAENTGTTNNAGAQAALPGAENVAAPAAAPESGVAKPRKPRQPAAPIENPDTLTGEALAAFNAKPEWERAEIRAKYLLQEARKQKEAAKGTKTPRAAKVAPPSFTLTHALFLAPKTSFIAPTDGGRADAFLAKSVKEIGVVDPFLAVQRPDGRLFIVDGKRRYFLLPEGASVPTVVISGVPGEDWERVLSVIVNRVRTPNVLAFAEVVGELDAKGETDGAIRSRLGLKAGEVENLRNLSNLPAAIRQGMTEGRVTQSVALLVAKQAESVREGLAAKFAQKTAEKADARLTEADVEEARKERTQAAVNRDAGTLGAAIASTPATVDEAAAPPAAPAPAQPLPAPAASPAVASTGTTGDTVNPQ